MEYKEPDYDYDQPLDENPKRNSEMGVKLAAIILLVLLIAVSVLYYRSVKVSEADTMALKVDMDTLQSQTQRLLSNLDVMKFDNDTLNRNLQSERHKADSLMDRLKSERRISYSKLKQYERELGTLRTAMQGFVRQIDSLNRLNQKLVGENLGYKKVISGLRAKTEIAEETAQELGLKVKRGAQVKCGKISVESLNKKGKVVQNIKQITSLAVSFDLVANELAQPGDRNVYVRIIDPGSINLQETQGTEFDFEGQSIPYTAMRTVEYDGSNLPVKVYYNGTGLSIGKYTVFVYMDGQMIGESTFILNKR